MPIKKTVTGGKLREAFETDKKGKIITAVKLDESEKDDKVPVSVKDTKSARPKDPR